MNNLYTTFDVNPNTFDRKITMTIDGRLEELQRKSEQIRQEERFFMTVPGEPELSSVDDGPLIVCVEYFELNQLAELVKMDWITAITPRVRVSGNAVVWTVLNSNAERENANLTWDQLVTGHFYRSNADHIRISTPGEWEVFFDASAGEAQEWEVSEE